MAPSRDSLPTEFTNGPAVIKAWAPWCSSCRAVAPLVEHVATTSGVSVCDVRIDADPGHLVGAFGVRSVPTLIALHDGTGAVTSQTPRALLASRAAAGSVLAAACLVFDTIVLVGVGGSLLAWALATLVRRAV